MWLTEGGFQKGSLESSGLTGDDYDSQRPVCDANFSKMLSTPGIYMWSQYIVFNREDGDPFLSGVGDGFFEEPPQPGGHTFNVAFQSDDGGVYGSGRAYGWWTSWQRKAGSTSV